MTLDATKPNDLTDVIADLPAYIRANRTQINTNETAIAAAGAVSTYSEVTINGATTIVTSTDTNNTNWDIILITATGSETLNNITGGKKGQYKVLILISGSLTITADDTKFKLVATGPSDDFVMGAGDALHLVNITGDGAGTDGYWNEVGRSIMVD